MSAAMPTVLPALREHTAFLNLEPFPRKNSICLSKQKSLKTN